MAVQGSIVLGYEDGRPPSPQIVAGLGLRRPETFSENEQLRLEHVRAGCPEIDALTSPVRSFATMVTERRGEFLPDQFTAVRQDALHTLAAGMARDRDAVIAGLTLPWNSGVVEGHVNRIKMLRRQVFGRAGFQLLRKKVLLGVTGD